MKHFLEYGFNGSLVKIDQPYVSDSVRELLISGDSGSGSGDWGNHPAAAAAAAASPRRRSTAHSWHRRIGCGHLALKEEKRKV